MGIQKISKSIKGYNNINLVSTQAERDAFQSMLGKFDADVIEALEVINNYGLDISFEELGKNTDGNNINGQAEVGGDKIKLDKDLLSDPSKLKDVFAHELAHILGESHEGTQAQKADFNTLETLLTNNADDQGYILEDVFENYRALQEAQSQDVSESENHMEKEKVKKPKETSGKTSDNDDVTVSDMATSSNGEGSFKNVKKGDQMVMTVSYSTDHGKPDIEKLEKDGWKVEYNKGAANGKKKMTEGEGDLATMVITKIAGENEPTSYKIPTKGGADDLSTQSFSVSGGHIAVEDVAEHAADATGKMVNGKRIETTTIDANKNEDAAFYLNVASADDPANYKKDNIKGDSGIVSFAASVAGDDAGASWITTDNDGSSINYEYQSGGNNDHGLSFAIVKN